METKIKTFDAVAESCNWRDASSQQLDAMTLEERIAYLQQIQKNYATQQEIGQRILQPQTAD